MGAAEIIQSILFIAAFGAAFFLFYRKAREIYDNIQMGKPEEIRSSQAFRIKKMVLIALGQKKMFKRPLAAVLHLFIYVAFLFTQIELIEIIIDGVSGKHRAVWQLLDDTVIAPVYTFLISFVEFLSVGAFIATVIFLWRRNVIRLPRFNKPEMKGFPSFDANLILCLEITLIVCLMIANSTDLALQKLGSPHYYQTGDFLFSQFLAPLFAGTPESTLIFLERVGWWGHIFVVLGFMVYIPYSKHLHIFLSFINTYYTRPEVPGEIKNMPSIMNEVKSMMDPSAAATDGNGEMSFGAKDVRELTWRHLLDAYTCTECGRCTAACPANLTGKKLSPRKIMMDTRDRMEHIRAGIKEHGPDFSDNKQLLGDYITREEILACTTCQACVEECPVNINPLSIIVELRRSMIMEEANSPMEWNNMFSTLENNQAPWQFSPADRANWVQEMN